MTQTLQLNFRYITLEKLYISSLLVRTDDIFYRLSWYASHFYTIYVSFVTISSLLQQRVGQAPAALVFVTFISAACQKVGSVPSV